MKPIERSLILKVGTLTLSALLAFSACGDGTEDQDSGEPGVTTTTSEGNGGPDY